MFLKLLVQTKLFCTAQENFVITLNKASKYCRQAIATTPDIKNAAAIKLIKLGLIIKSRNAVNKPVRILRGGTN